MEPSIRSISSDANNVHQEMFPFGQWTILTRKGFILQSQCSCKQTDQKPDLPVDQQSNEDHIEKQDSELCQICWFHKRLPQLNNMPDMLFKDNLFKLEHYTGVGIEFNPLDALKLVKETRDPLQVAVADGWQSARSEFPFAKSIAKPYDWTLTTDYRGTLLSAIKKNNNQKLTHQSETNQTTSQSIGALPPNTTNRLEENSAQVTSVSPEKSNDVLCFQVEETDERIDVNKLKVREEILFYDDITLYEDELADHGTAEYRVKVRVMPKSLFILARYYLRIDNVLARINDTRIYYELNRRYLLREYTNREAKLSSIPNLPVSTVINPNELMNHLPIIESRYEKLHLPKLQRV